MKRYFRTYLLISLVLLLISADLRSQNVRYRLQEHDQKRYYFGFYLATNQMNFSINTKRSLLGSTHDLTGLTNISGVNLVEFYGVYSEPTMGFTIGLVGNKKINQYMDLRFTPGLAFGERNLKYTFKDLRFTDSVFTEDVPIRTTQIELPVTVNFKSKRAKNFRAYVLAGAKLSIDLAVDSDSNNSINNGVVVLNKSSLNIEVGTGFDYYMSFFKFGVELKMAYGINDIKSSSGNIYSDGIRTLRSKIFMLSLTFE